MNHIANKTAVLLTPWLLAGCVATQSHSTAHAAPAAEAVSMNTAPEDPYAVYGRTGQFPSGWDPSGKARVRTNAAPEDPYAVYGNTGQFPSEWQSKGVAEMQGPRATPDPYAVYGSTGQFPSDSSLEGYREGRADRRP